MNEAGGSAGTSGRGSIGTATTGDVGTAADPPAVGARRPPRCVYRLRCESFTPAGTFEAAAARLAEVADLGVEAVAVALPFPTESPAAWPRAAGLRSFVGDAKRHGLAVVGEFACVDSAGGNIVAPSAEAIAAWVCEFDLTGAGPDGSRAAAAAEVVAAFAQGLESAARRTGRALTFPNANSAGATDSAVLALPESTAWTAPFADDDPDEAGLAAFAASLTLPEGGELRLAAAESLAEPRPDGLRPFRLGCFESRKLRAAAHLLGPHVPVLGMGQEYDEARPFVAVDGTVPQLTPDDDWTDEQRTMRAFVRHLLRLRKGPATRRPERTPIARAEVLPHRQTVALHRSTGTGEPNRSTGTGELHRGTGTGELLILFHFGTAPRTADWPVPAGDWRQVLDSGDIGWRGTVPPSSAVRTSAGSLQCTLSPRAVLVLQRVG